MTSAFDLLTEADLKEETVKEPAKRWKNWWRVVDARGPYVEGDVYPGLRTWPSKDIALTMAARPQRFPTDIHIDALPEGQRP